MANEQNLKPIRNSKIARELQEKSVKKRKENRKKRKKEIGKKRHLERAYCYY